MPDKTKDEYGYTPDNYQPLPNKEAIVHFNGKTLLTAESYLDVKAYEHALAFTVAGLMDEDLLKDVRDAVASAMENGTDFREFKRTLKPYLMAKGWLAETLDDGTQQLVAGSNRRLRTIYSTNLQTAYSAGQWERIQQTKEFLPYLQYMPSVSENPRLSHKRYYGLCRPADDTIWQSIMPPNGWGCFLPDTQIQGDLQSAMLKFYQGVAVKFTTKSGRNLAVTANHPILTERGWVRADSLTTSDNVLCYGLPVDNVGILSGQVNHNQTVATAKNLFKTFFDDAMAVTGTTAFKFNSDVANGEIHIDIFDDGLVLHIRADSLQGIQKVELIRGDNGRFVTIGETDGSSKFAIIVNDFIGFQNSSDITTTAIKAFCQSTLAYFGCSIQLDNFSFQFVITRATDSPSLATLPFNATSRLFDGLPTDNAGTAHISQGDTILKELASNAFTTDFGLFGNLIDTHASLVFADPIVNIRQFSFSGHVYDFQSSESIVSANGIVAHNCKCWVKQLTKRQAQKVGISEEKPLEMEDYKNPKTGEVSKVPVGVDPSFAHNHDRFTALIRLAKDKHGRLFANNLKDEAQKLMPATLPVGVPTVPVASGETVTDTVKPPVKTPEQPQPTPETEINWDELISQWLEYDVESSKLGQYEYAYKRLDKKKFPLSKEEFIALRHYTANGFKDLNRYLRGDLPADSDIQTLFDNVEKLLNNGLEKLPLYKGKKVVRRIELNSEQISEYNTAYETGENITFTAFSSTTTNAKDVVVGGQGNVRFVIKHKTGRDVRKLSHYESEGEVLLGTPTKYKVDKVEDLTTKKGYVEIHLEEIANE